jgi:hypothetical protein
MKTEIPNDVLGAITAVVYWARSSDGDDDILSYDIPLLDAWIVKLGLLPPAETPMMDEDWRKFNAEKAAWEAARDARWSQCD